MGMLKEAHIGQNRLCAGSKNRQDILGYKYIRHILSFKLRLIKGLLTFRCKIPTKSATRYKTLQNCIVHLISQVIFEQGAKGVTRVGTWEDF